jgi:hypothetical protein
MFPHQNSSWVLLVAAPLGFVLYVSVLLAVLWVAVRVVRHAWYWKAPTAASKTLQDRE